MKYLLSYMILWTCCINLTFMTVNSNGITDNLDSGIVNGREAKEGEFPWMVALYLNGTFACSSTLISPTIVMTAAHCVQFEDGIPPATSFYGIVGNINREGPETRIQFQEVVAHPQFDANQSLDNDIAILRMCSPLEMDKWIQPICLPQDDRAFDIETVQTMGWGSIYIRRNDVAEYMTTTELSILPRHTCKEIFAKHKDINITNKNICVYSQKPTGLCYGDSGSPAVYNDPDSGKPVAIGVASFISYYGCFIPKAPRVYTMIASYINWIKETVGDHNDICFV
ncbi:transmembrane protease serine 9-like [Argiope bruennichi]|uniref:transmembrane protease serine 9-like n=1 Tax=Argiope bruennichi TaxID=94029 RepID=UPI002494BA00|nr:transmembrane protease serine 9-like [Argiope bruennichi]